MRSMILLWVVLVGLAASAPARGQEAVPSSRPIELGVHAGAIKFEDPLMNGKTHAVLGGRAVYRFPNGVMLGARIGRTGRDETIEAIGGGRIRRAHETRTLLALLAPPAGLFLFVWWVMSQPTY